MDDFSDRGSSVEVCSSEDELEMLNQKGDGTIKNPSADFDPGFTFEETSEDVFEHQMNKIKRMAKQGTKVNLDDRINSARKKRAKEEASGDVEESLSCKEDSSELYVDDEKTHKVEDVVREKKRKAPAKQAEVDDFFDHNFVADLSLTFEEMNFSRPIAKAICAVNYAYPTPVQSACIPIALLGKDLCVCSATGTGKTAAYIIPVLDRLIYRPVGGRKTRVLVLVPTRELAVQVFETGQRLAQFTDISIGLSVGGMSVKSQEAALRACPDIVIATPGRLIDHLRNSPSFNLCNVEVLILDEADRMLDDAFSEQMKEVIRLCSPTRQSMLFSATMTDEVKDLAAVSLNKPVKLFVNENTQMALNLRQEFVRIRKGREGDRDAIMLALLKRNYRDHVLMFAPTKLLCHRLRILLGLAGINADELHGKLPQAQRMEALEKFKSAQVDVLIASDVAARGIDVQGVKYVFNYALPSTFKQYVHRVGRTARAGRSGLAVSLVTEEDRKILKEIVKYSKTTVKQRVLSRQVVEKFQKQVTTLKEDVERVAAEAEAERQLAIADKQAAQALKTVEEGKRSSPPRTWFKEESKKKQHQQQQRSSFKYRHALDPKLRGKFASRKERRKEMAQLTNNGQVNGQIRMGKRQFKAKRMRTFAEPIVKNNAVGKKRPQAESKFKVEMKRISSKRKKSTR